MTDISKLPLFSEVMKTHKLGSMHVRWCRRCHKIQRDHRTLAEENEVWKGKMAMTYAFYCDDGENAGDWSMNPIKTPWNTFLDRKDLQDLANFSPLPDFDEVASLQFYVAPDGLSGPMGVLEYPNLPTLRPHATESGRWEVVVNSYEMAATLCMLARRVFLKEEGEKQND
jgi:hypothetical protein